MSRRPKPAPRVRISSDDIGDIHGLAPLAGIQRLSGVRVHDVGQGDSITILDEHKKPALQFDYGGLQGRGFATGAQAAARVPVDPGRLLMLSHWDEDHWCAADGTADATTAQWLVPRQLTSPRAAAFAAKVDNIACVPDHMATRLFSFSAANGDRIFWEKIAAGPGPRATKEDCNATGIAMSVVRPAGSSGQVILLPGDAPFHKVAHYKQLFKAGYKLAGLVAFHHGSRKHWTEDTRKLLRHWARMWSGRPDIIFSCSSNNSHGHPHIDLYDDLIDAANCVTTFELREKNLRSIDLLF